MRSTFFLLSRLTISINYYSLQQIAFKRSCSYHIISYLTKSQQLTNTLPNLIHIIKRPI
ncbi:hypothetical protein Pint_11881 [Pistacia integerrima]|uniref:Uncharacterized protein n=1 Tax=Pistacia integerrima TaxID=434235 RepID=A0ACC0XG35_9ROSI|nr:hypothetical protein Pint_11881 [Pistacia integerrima]